MGRAVDEPFAERLRAESTGTKWLFVGRIAPNKAPHEVVRAFAWYRRAVDANAVLWLVGGAPADGYAAFVARLAERLGVADAVTLAGTVSDAALGAYYAAADVFVGLSAHEGFGVPIVEAMSAGLPVVALAAAAVPETAGGAALLVDRVDPALVAGAVARLQRDARLHDAFVRAGRARAAQFGPDISGAALLAAVRPLLEGIKAAA